MKRYRIQDDIDFGPRLVESEDGRLCKFAEVKASLEQFINIVGALAWSQENRIELTNAAASALYDFNNAKAGANGR